MRFRALKAGEDFNMLLRVLVCVLSLAFAAGAAAQAYRWVDKDGRVRYGDMPPPGVKATPLGLPQGGGVNVAPAAPDAAAKGASKGPLTPAEQEKEYRKRQAEGQKSREKEEKEQRDAAAKQENCARARETLAALESGQRVVRTRPDGERYYLEDSQRDAEIEQARQSVNSWCN
jgi:hypothetical protein